MAHFAQLNSQNIVEKILVVSNDDCGGGDFPTSEPIGQAFLKGMGLIGTWLQTSYHANFRGKYASIGDTYDAEADEFIAPPVEV